MAPRELWGPWGPPTLWGNISHERFLISKTGRTATISCEMKSPLEEILRGDFRKCKKLSEFHVSEIGVEKVLDYTNRVVL